MDPLTPDVARALRSEFEAFIRSTEADPLDLRTVAREAGVLPVLRGWGGLGAIRLDGAPVEVTYDPPYTVTEFTDPWPATILFGHCVTKFPALEALRPTKPDNAIECQLCHGTGESETAVGGVCLCGGLGWYAPNTEGAT